MTRETTSSKTLAQPETPSSSVESAAPTGILVENTFVTGEATAEEFDAEFDAIVEASEESQASSEDDKTREVSRFKSVRSKLGGLATRAYWGGMEKIGSGMQALSNLSERRSKKREARYEKYAAEIGDSRLALARKFLGRNATKIVTGGLVVAAASVAATVVAAKLKYGIEGGGNAASAHETVQQSGEIVHTANTQILVGGRGMPDGDAMRPLAKGLGLHGDKTIGIDYPAQIKTLVTPGDTHTLDQSSSISAQKVYDAYNANKNGTVEIVGYSEGTQGVQDALDRIARENGGTLPDNISVKIIASPNTEGSGIFNDPKTQMLKPLFEANGADIDRPIPKGKNVQVIAMNTDFWANSGNRPPSTMISQAIGLAGDGHRVPTEGMRYTERVVNGTTYRTYYHEGTQNAALRVAEQHGFKVTKKADQFANALAPTGELGQENVRVNAGEVLRTGSAAAEEALTANGVAPQQAQVAKQVIENIPAAPVQVVFDAVQDIPNQLANTSQVQEATTPIQPVVEQVAPQISQAVEQVQKVAPQLAPQIEQGKALLGQFGVKLG